jgi:hypothetical protein
LNALANCKGRLIEISALGSERTHRYIDRPCTNDRLPATGSSNGWPRVTERGNRQAARPASAMTMERKTSICCDFAYGPQTAANEVIV